MSSYLRYSRSRHVARLRGQWWYNYALSNL